MKDFSYYANNSEVPYPDRAEQGRVWMKEINDAPMTAQARSAALDGLRFRLQQWMKEQLVPYHEAQQKLTDEFWQDCRKELGYVEYLSEPAIQAVEAYAWREGHSGGYSDVFYTLSELVDLLKVVTENPKEKG